MIETQSRSQELLNRLDDTGVTRHHWKIMLISGMGFFTDAYDLFIIGVVMALLKSQWHPNALYMGLVSSTALLASAIGAIIFGRVADMVGRKRIYGYECLVLAAGAILSALSPNIIWLIVFRFILGVGIGGDYPVSATIMGEYAGKKSRGLLVTLVFTMQAAGLIVGPLLAAAFLSSHLSPHIIWRVLLAVGALPALFVFNARRQISETPRFLLATGQSQKFQEAADDILDENKSKRGSAEYLPEAASMPSFAQGFNRLAANRVWFLRLLGASMAWFLIDFAYYGNTVSSPLVLSALEPHADLLHTTLLVLLVFTVAALPGYFVAAFTMDKIGRKTIQMLGFAVMGLSFTCLALMPDIKNLVAPFLIIYGTSYFFTEFGPNSTTFVYPNELFPVEVRTTGNGIAAAMGKIGAFAGVFTFPLLMNWHGLEGAEMTAAFVSVLGLFVTLGLLPETKGKSLEELSIP
jgi:PHS family inorganic phosphate transporter-like MFS transporter